MYFGLSIVFVFNTRVPTQKTLICNIASLVEASPRTIDVNADPQCNPMTCKEPGRKTNRHTHSTHDQNTGLFSKKKIKEVFQQLTLTRIIWGPFVQKRKELILQTMYSMVQSYHALLDICCPLIPRYNSPGCPVLWGEQFLEA